MNILVGLIVLVLGAVVCFSGYRIFRVVLMLVGFLIGFTLGMAIMANSGGIGQVLVGVVVGLIGAGVFYALYFVGVFLAGVALGAVVGLTIASILGASGGLATILVLIGVIGGAILAIVLNKLMIVISTAFGGANTMVQGLAIILPGVFAASNVGAAATALSTSFIGFIVWIVLGVAGVAVQYRNNKAEIESNKPIK
jgi:hypothetical protein